jgi:NAD(P)-dependent dehydrogenase (short-subunit alcohol dehydrogenase family)
VNFALDFDSMLLRRLLMRQGWGRIINVTTSLRTMLNAGSPTYGPSKSALEALRAIMAKDLDGTGFTVNVLVPGGITNTPMISDAVGFNRARQIQPEIMAVPLLRLISDAAGPVLAGPNSRSVNRPENDPRPRSPLRTFSLPRVTRIADS